jgi:hypothetical protein
MIQLFDNNEISSDGGINNGSYILQFFLWENYRTILPGKYLCANL